MDIGTQSLKAVVVDDRLRVIGEGSAGYPHSLPGPGRAEQDPHDWERALGTAIRIALDDAEVSAAQVCALGIAGQLDGCVAVDAAGAPLSPCLIWMDRRAELPPLPEDARAITGVVPDPGHMAAKIRWLAAHHRGAVRYHQPVSYLVARLTGEAVMDRALASTTMLYDLRAGAWRAELLDAFAIDAAVLPRIDEAHAIAGTLHDAGARLAGLPSGIPVAVGTGDDFATPLGAGVAAPGPIACVVGTAEVVGTLAPAMVIDGDALVETHAYPAGGWFIENPGWLSGGALDWIHALLAGPGLDQLDRMAEAVPAGCDGVTFVPALTGAMAPEWIPQARACFDGLSAAHGQGHLARAVMEGCAFAMRDVVDHLAALGVGGEHLLLLGGGARSRVWAQIRADVGGLPVELGARTDTCAVGAAMLAAVAAGVVGDVPAAAALITRDGDVLMPDPEGQDASGRAYARYRRLFGALRTLW
ncbi:MAG TPA: FGGY family carbohydrate kinase [Kofleriaceae bacterium]|nr:FGGY family carbohydrate kinase [Kofleriaceae bacterium]